MAQLTSLVREGVSIPLPDENEYEGLNRCLSVSRSKAKGTLLLFVPSSSIVLSNQLEPSIAQAPCSPISKLALFLCGEKEKQRDSEWFHYLCSLPGFDGNEYDHPVIEPSVELLTDLASTCAAQSVVKESVAYKHQLKLLGSHLHTLPEHFRWGYEMALSIVHGLTYLAVLAIMCIWLNEPYRGGNAWRHLQRRLFVSLAK